MKIVDFMTGAGGYIGAETAVVLANEETVADVTDSASVDRKVKKIVTKLGVWIS